MALFDCFRSSLLFVGRSANVLFDDSLGSIDFRPSNNVAVIYVSEAELVAGNIHRRKIVKLRKASKQVFWNG
jgi:hypothetical protein